MLLLVTAIWGSGFVAADIAIEDFDVNFVLAVRFLIGFIGLFLVSAKTVKNMKKTTIKKGLILGALAFIAFWFQIVGLKYTTPSKNAFMTATNVIMVPFIGMFLLGNRVNKKNVVGAFITLIGVSFLTLDVNFSISKGDLLTLVCAFLFAFHIVGTGEFSKGENVLHLTFVQMGISCLLGGIILMFTGFDVSGATMRGVLALIYLGIAPTATAFAMQTWAQKYTTETEAAIILSFESVFGTIFSIIILGEMLTYKMVIGSALIMLSILISELNIAKLRNMALGR